MEQENINGYINFINKKRAYKECSYCLNKDLKNIQYINAMYSYILLTCTNCGKSDIFYIHYLDFIAGNYSGTNLRSYFNSKKRQVL